MRYKFGGICEILVTDRTDNSDSVRIEAHLLDDISLREMVGYGVGQEVLLKFVGVLEPLLALLELALG